MEFNSRSTSVIMEFEHDSRFIAVWLVAWIHRLMCHFFRRTALTLPLSLCHTVARAILSALIYLLLIER